MPRPYFIVSTSSMTGADQTVAPESL